MKKNTQSNSLKKTSVFLVLLFGLIFSVQSQNKSEFWQHVAFGGSVGLSFGDGFFGGTIAPSAIYRFNPQFAMGLGANYTYNEEKNFYRSSIIGGSLIGLYNPIPQLQLSAEFEQLNVNRNYNSSTPFLDENYWYPALFMGVGYNAGPVAMGIRFDVLYDRDKSIYANSWAPFVRVYF
ncbi:alpha-ketoglutarate decarboxylase [Hanstruepera marina]|uniref:alpha-ketoglutarate decarboxylase n=1 Tax=Hanstruepera marina TaxID=2873265 RepID=UPI001CA689B6|nr:alpha-ketoglutarate decarboxylase [Hanstruepera marina]